MNDEEELAAGKSISAAPGIFGDLILALDRRRQGMGGNLVGNKKGSKDEKSDGGNGDANEFEFAAGDDVSHDSSDWDP